MARKLAYSAAEAAQVLGCSEDTVRRAVNAGELPVVPRAIVGNRVLIPVAALEQQIAEHTERRAS